MAYIDLVSTSESTITVQMAGLDTGYTVSDRTCDWYIDGSYDGSVRLGAGISSGGRYTFRGLDSDTRYSLKALITAPSVAGSYTFTGSAWTDPPAIQIDPWSWSSSNGSASSTQTRNALTAVQNNGYLTNFSYLVWNDLCDKVKEVLDAIGAPWDSYYASYSSTRMSSGDRYLTAKRFNSLRYNVGSYYATGINEVSRGDIVYGWYFVTITNSLNMWISTL